MENFTNCTDFEVDGKWRARGKPFEWFDGFVCFLVLIGIIGNSLVIYIKHRLSRTQVTPINRLVVCLAVADLLTAVFILPLPEYENLPRSPWAEFYCHVIESRFFLWVSFRASVYTLTVIAIERFLAIVHPFIYRARVHNRNVKYTIAAIWIIPLVLRFPQLLWNVVGPCGRCDFVYRSRSSAVVYTIVLFVVEFVCPLIIMVYTSIKIIIMLRRERFHHADTIDPSRSRRPTQLQAIQRRFTIMFIFICATFMLLWTPDQLGIFLYRLGVFSRAYTEQVYQQVFLKLSFLNGATTNPIIYSICLPVFRRAVKEVVTCRRTSDRTQAQMMEMTTTPSPV
ncbi:allatostatin-A receptor-like [Lytechinus pictus]|uniref:allatostatin-A receptor-like n=1 Tax=Lytechinus pictus TaxID=7653 RepID=UPI0030B9C25A